jgi:hypothetical protein
MKKNIIIIALIIFIGLLMVYSFQQKSYADVRIIELEMKLTTCQENVEKQMELAKAAEQEAIKQKEAALIAVHEASRQKEIAESKK